MVESTINWDNCNKILNTCCYIFLWLGKPLRAWNMMSMTNLRFTKVCYENHFSSIILHRVGLSINYFFLPLRPASDINWGDHRMSLLFLFLWWWVLILDGLSFVKFTKEDHFLLVPTLIFGPNLLWDSPWNFMPILLLTPDYVDVNDKNILKTIFLAFNSSKTRSGQRGPRSLKADGELLKNPEQ